MDRRLISFLLRTPDAWIACAHVAWAILCKRPSVTVWMQELRNIRNEVPWAWRIQLHANDWFTKAAINIIARAY